MLRRMLHRVTKIPYNEITLGRTEKGKPYLLNTVEDIYKDLSFNVSHHGDYVVLAAEVNTAVGIDTMKLEKPAAAKTLSEYFRIMRRQFTTDEWSQIESGQTDEEKLCTYYRLWCLKESYVKLLGIGIGFEVIRLNFNLIDKLTEDGQTSCMTTLKVDDIPVNDWIFEEMLMDHHWITVALRPKNMQVKRPFTQFEILSFNELLEDSSPLSDPDQEYGEQFIQKPNNPADMKKS
ncbi:hypothetical protein ACF0H5_010355 [Mactra antiquata]